MILVKGTRLRAKPKGTRSAAAREYTVVVGIT